MERKIFLIIFILLCSTTKAQQQVSVSTARTAAITTMRYNKLFYSEEDIRAVNLFISERDTILYEVKFNNNHSVLLSGSFACQPILGYNFSYDDETALDKFDEIPPGLQSMIQEYIDQIELCFANDTITLWHEKDWADLMSFNRDANEVYVVVEPMITTMWGQNDSNWCDPGAHIDFNAYNYYVSETGSACGSTYNNCPTGCVATAMAQIMNYWKHPVYNPDYGSHFVAYIDECEKCEEENLGERYNNEYEKQQETSPLTTSLDIEKEMYIIPNPNNGSFFVSLSNTEEKIIGIRVVDIMGKTVYIDNKFAGGDVVLPNVKQGLYYVTVVLKNGAMTEKIVIK